MTQQAAPLVEADPPEVGSPGNPHAKLEQELAAATEAFDRAYAADEDRRVEIRRRIEQLTAEMEALDAPTKPLKARMRELYNTLHLRRGLTVGPWVVLRNGLWPEGFLYLHGSKKEWHACRAWLRVVLRETYRWEAQVRYFGPVGNLDLVLDPPSDDPEADIAAHKKVVEATIRKHGGFVMGDVPEPRKQDDARGNQPAGI